MKKITILLLFLSIFFGMQVVNAQTQWKVDISFIKKQPIYIEFQKIGNYFEGRYAGYNVIVIDRDKNNKPDLSGDVWLWKKGNKTLFAWSFSDYRFYYYLINGRKYSIKDLIEAVPTINKYAAASYLSGAVHKKSSNKNLIYPYLIIENWAKNGQYLYGNLFDGGCLTEGRIFRGSNFYAAYDIKKVGIPDFFLSNGLVLFNFKHKINHELKVSLKYPSPSILMPAYITVIGMEHSYFSKTFITGAYYKGAVQGFEEHIFLKEKPSKLFPHGAQFFMYSMQENPYRLDMGGFETNSSLTWNIELQPRYSVWHQPPSRQICEYKDLWGHSFKFLSFIYPKTWNGQTLHFSKNTPDFFPNAPWAKVISGKYYKITGVRFIIVPKGSYYYCNEGMYGGDLEWQDRIEINNHVNYSIENPFTIYYNPLICGLDLKGALFGYKGFPYGYQRGSGNPFDLHYLYHKEALSLPAKYCGVRDLSAPEAKRLDSPIWLYMVDRHNTGYFNTYLYDMSNNGIYDKVIFYNRKSGYIDFSEGHTSTIFYHPVQFIDIPYQMQDYNKVRHYYLKGYKQPSFIDTVQMTSSGRPMWISRVNTLGGRKTFTETWPHFYISFQNRWKNRIAIYNPGSTYQYSWKDFGINGFVRFNTILTENNIGLTQIKKINKTNLEGIDILFIPNLNSFITTQEIGNLQRWIEKGGIVILGVPENNIKTFFFDGMGKFFGYRIGDNIINNRTTLYHIAIEGAFGSNSPIGQGRIPSPGNEIKNYTGNSQILNNIKLLSFVGYPLEINNSFTPLLTWKGKVLIADKKIGKGRLIISGINCFSNKYILGPQFYEPGVQNNRFLSNFANYLKGKIINKFKIVYPDKKEPTLSFGISGKGGNIMFPNSNSFKYKVFVNGKDIKPIQEGRVLILNLPSGTYKIKIQKVGRVSITNSYLREAGNGKTGNKKS
ncbi:MAG: hypothetical protein M1135_02555 [Candidatus Omnitrophica bacterium]|nr:hypothetical protein [Candidatus Omnitrophota bacterium]